MQPPTQNTSPASKSDPSNPYQNTLAPNAEPDLVVVKSQTGEIVALGSKGKSGTYIFNGIITREEYNPDLLRWQALTNYDIMRRSDATVQAALDIVKLPILSADWSLKPYSDDQDDVDVAAWVRYNLFEWNIVFPDLLSEILTFQDFGYSVFEKVLDYCDWTPPEIQPPTPKAEPPKPDENGEIQPVEKPEPPDPIVRPSQKMIGLTALESRKQRSIYRWQTNETTPRFGITQYVPGGTYSIEGDKLVVFTRKKEGENYEGISVLRAMYKHWKIKDALELIEAIRHERQGLGVLEIIPPAGANEDDITDAIENARNARASEEAVIKHPDGWTIQWMDMKSGSTQLTDIGSTLEYHKREMMKAVLAQFMELGGGKSASGSRATSQDHSALFMLSEEYTAKYIDNVFNRSIIKELVDLNFSNVKGYPTLEHSKIGDDNLTTIGTVVNQLASADMLTPDAGLEQWLRQALHAPDLPDDMVENYEKIKTPPPPIIAPPQPPNAPAEGDDPNNTDEQTKTAKEALNNARKAKAKLLDVLVG